jgi:hypothetical protein
MTDDMQARKEAFMSEYKLLIEKHSLDFMSFPQFLPDGKGGWTIVLVNNIVDTTEMPTPSPFVVEK